MATNGIKEPKYVITAVNRLTGEREVVSRPHSRWKTEEMLTKAEREGLRVLCAGHYNLLPEVSAEPGSGYYVENGDALAALLREHGVPLYLSGHMHLRAVYHEAGLTELLTEYSVCFEVESRERIVKDIDIGISAYRA